MCGPGGGAVPAWSRGAPAWSGGVPAWSGAWGHLPGLGGVPAWSGGGPGQVPPHGQISCHTLENTTLAKTSFQLVTSCM